MVSFKAKADAGHGADKASKTSKAIASKYVKLDQREHVLTRPNMYIGSIEPDTYATWVIDETGGVAGDEKDGGGARFAKKSLRYIPGCLKIVDEILVNAIDHYTRRKMAVTKTSGGGGGDLVKNIKVLISKETGVIEVTNDGEGIEIVKHPEHDIWIPELIFGNLLTSTNYDDTDEKIIGGQNGLGSKCLSLDTKVPLFDGTIKFASNIKIGDLLIGDDGNVRKVQKKTRGKGNMFKVSQTMGESYKVNDEHILTLHMPDHKVIFWCINSWRMLWWDNKTRTIQSKLITVSRNQIECDECGEKLVGNLKRHYFRRHPGIVCPSKPRSPPTYPDMHDEEVRKVYNTMMEFADSIDDNNVIDMSIKEFMELPTTTKKRLAGVRCDCVNWEDKSVDIDPYILGLWLGDGYSYSCDAKNDPEIIDYFNQWAQKNDAQLKQTARYGYSISSKDNFRKKGYAPLRKQLLKYDLIKSKRIPKEYLVNSREVRLQVLAGLIDTDGSAHRKGTRIQISQGMMHEELINDILHLARSLGYYCTLRKCKATYVWKGEKRQKDCLKMNMSGEIAEIPTRLSRKVCRAPFSRNTGFSTGQITVEPIGMGDYVGFEIDGNKRFVINDFTVTHNCSNIFSDWFEVETVDHVRKLHYKQRFEKNMEVVGDAEIVKFTKKPFTTIRFKPDYQKLNMPSGLTQDMYQMIEKRVYDTCAVTDNDLSVHLNGVKLDYKNFEKYVDLYLGTKDGHSRVYEKISDRWEVVASYNDAAGGNNGFEQVSFVNGIWTIRGGKHVEYISGQIIKKLTELVVKKNKGVTVKPQAIKDNLILFVKSTIVNPTFDSQSKETLTTPISKFGSKGEISDKFIEKLYKTGIVEKILQLSQLNDAKVLQKTDGKKRSVIRGLPKLEDANWAGGPKSKECCLILTEGDSASSMAIAGISEIGRDRYGVFPLKGKLMNVKDQTVTKIADNDEITNIKKILGLENGKEYNSVEDLRYGKIMVLCDQDVDGHHIKGLLFNMFQSMWPSLVKCNEFLTSMLTPIVKATRKGEIIQFYNLTDYENWVKKIEAEKEKGWETKYYKGLGTSTSEEAKGYFKDLKTIQYMYTGDVSDERLDLAFNKKKADERKDWLSGYDRQIILDHMDKEVTYEDFVDKELIHFSNYDVERSIPNMCDGLKVSQRKILFSCFKKNLVKEIKVAQLAGYVSENAAYHHGEASLQGAIVGMAQNFVGSNNINLLKPNGMFGTRRCGGKDAASPRYIFTQLSALTDVVFPKSDMAVLKYLVDDGWDVEPEYYMPILPMVLVNGAIGIGTGFSTNVPCYNPMDIVRVLKRMLGAGGGGVSEGGDGEDGVMKSEEFEELVPWYRGFKGKIEKGPGGKFQSKGTFVKTSATKVDITELPVGYWTQDFKEHLEEAIDKHPDIRSYESHYKENDIKFTLIFASAAACDEFLARGGDGLCKLEKELKLVSNKNLSTSNMYLFNHKCQITKYDSAIDIIRGFYDVRLDYYQKRKDYILAKLLDDIELLNNKIRFIKAVVAEEIVVHKMKKNELEERIEADGYMKHDDKYDYLTRIPIYNFTIDKVNDLENEKRKADEEIDRVRGLDIKLWWSEDLDQFVKVYEVEGGVVAGAGGPAATTGKKKYTKKTA